MWGSAVEPGSVHAITAARSQGILGALYVAADKGVPSLVDRGCVGSGIGIMVPTKGRNLRRCRNTLLSAMLAPAERANALLKALWKALRRVTLCPWRIGPITAASTGAIAPSGPRLAR